MFNYGAQNIFRFVSEEYNSARILAIRLWTSCLQDILLAVRINRNMFKDYRHQGCDVC